MASDRGGDVKGSCKTDVDGAVGSPITVARASYEPGYEIEWLKPEGYTSEADLKQGYASYGIAIGEGHPPGMIGGKK